MLFVLIADYQTITDRDSPVSLADDVEGVIADHLAVASTRPRRRYSRTARFRRSTNYVLPFLSLVSVAEVSRNPTVKEEYAATGGSAMSALMFTYPVQPGGPIFFSATRIWCQLERTSCRIWS